MEEIARVYSESLFEAARDRGSLDDVHEQLGAVADEVATNQDLQVFFFSPYFSSAEKKDGISLVVSDADPVLVNFLELLAEKHRMPALFRVRHRFDELWAKENRRLEVTVTSAVELDPTVVREVGEAIERQTGQTVDLTSRVDESIVGGLVLQVGNMVMDASIHNRLEKLRKEIAQAA